MRFVSTRTTETIGITDKSEFSRINIKYIQRIKTKNEIFSNIFYVSAQKELTPFLHGIVKLCIKKH